MKVEKDKEDMVMDTMVDAVMDAVVDVAREAQIEEVDTDVTNNVEGGDTATRIENALIVAQSVKPPA